MGPKYCKYQILERSWRYQNIRHIKILKKKLIYKSKTCGNVPVTISVNRYAKNKGLSVELYKYPYKNDDSYFGSITVNLPGGAPKHCAYVDTNKMSGVLPFLKEYRLAAPLPIVAESGFCTYPLFVFNIEKLREYAPEDVATYESYMHNDGSGV